MMWWTIGETNELISKLILIELEYESWYIFLPEFKDPQYNTVKDNVIDLI